jgi:hypothetical protein
MQRNILQKDNCQLDQGIFIIRELMPRDKCARAVEEIEIEKLRKSVIEYAQARNSITTLFSVESARRRDNVAVSRSI